MAPCALRDFLKRDVTSVRGALVREALLLLAAREAGTPRPTRDSEPAPNLLPYWRVPLGARHTPSLPWRFVTSLYTVTPVAWVFRNL